MAETPKRLRLPPDDDTPLLDWWARDYDHVFIAFNPFFHVPDFTPATAAFGPVYAEVFDEDEAVAFLDALPRRGNEAPENFEQLIKTTGEPVSWREVQEETGASDFNVFARTLWLWTIHQDAADQDPRVVEALETCEEAGLYRPETDSLPIILEPVIHRYLTALGIEKVTLWSEWRDQSSPRAVADFAPDQPVSGLDRSMVSAITCDDPKIMLAWSNDGIESFICIPEEARKVAPPEQFFEGRYAAVDTTLDWLAPPAVRRFQHCN